MNLPAFPGRAGIQQRVLPLYRQAFFDMLAQACQGGLSVFSGEALPEENVKATNVLQHASYYPARNYNFFPISSSLYQCWQGGLLAWLKTWQPDVLVVEANPRYPSTRLAIRWMHARGRPVIGWGLGAPPADPHVHSKLSSVQRLMLRWRIWERITFLRSLDGLIAYSQRGAEQYRELDLPYDHIHVAPNAVSPRPTSPIPPARPAAIDGPATVLYVGRLQTRKRIDHLIQVCADLPQEIKPRLVVVGDGPARSELEELAAKVYPPTEFLGARHGDELAGIFQTADQFVLPGTGGLAIQQAMTYALPVIVAEGDGTQDDLVRPENGFLIPPDDLPALQKALTAALSDLGKLRRMGEASYRIVFEEANLEAMVAAFVRSISTAVRKS